MFKKLLLCSFLMCATCSLSAQLTALADYNQQRIDINRKAMTILGAWAAGNIVLGAALQARDKGSSQHYFHRMNAYWNVVNLGLAAAGLYTALHTDPTAFDAYQTVGEQHKIQKILLFNAGLDVGYIMTGLYLTERSKNTANHLQQARLRGFGQSLLLQGAFLFIFDWAVFAAHARHNKGLQQFMQQLSFDGNSIGFHLIF